MSRAKNLRLRTIKESTERKKLFGGNGFISMPHSDTNKFDIVIYKNSLKNKRQEVKNYECNCKQTHLYS